MSRAAVIADKKYQGIFICTRFLQMLCESADGVVEAEQECEITASIWVSDVGRDALGDLG